MIQAFFFDLQTINGGGSRPDGIEQTPINKIGVLGAGMMGAGIAYVSAKAGYDVVLKDVSLEAAQKGKGYSEKLEAKALERGRTTEEKSKALLDKITPTGDAADLKGVDFVIEAVFENQDLKHKVFQEIEDIVEPNAVLGSNTSTLPITGLATGVKREEDFIGIHFFSPVDKMPLVEIIKGEKTSDEALARVFDYTLAIGKTPIVVNDSRGFFTSRVIGTFVNEALAMLGEGVEPASIEQAGSQAGYPAPPLQLSDELNLELMHKIAVATRKGVEDAGGTYEPHPAEAVVEKMIELGRSGRLKGAGFYEYPDGKRTGLWPGLRETFKSGASEPPLQDMIDRMLFAEALETQKCLDEGVLDVDGRRQHWLDHGHRFPAVDRRQRAVHRRLLAVPAVRARKPSWPVPASWPPSTATASCRRTLDLSTASSRKSSDTPCVRGLLRLLALRRVGTPCTASSHTAAHLGIQPRYGLGQTGGQRRDQLHAEGQRQDSGSRIGNQGLGDAAGEGAAATHRLTRFPVRMPRTLGRNRHAPLPIRQPGCIRPIRQCWCCRRPRAPGNTRHRPPG